MAKWVKSRTRSEWGRIWYFSFRWGKIWQFLHLILLLFETTWFGSGLSAIFEKSRSSYHEQCSPLKRENLGIQ